MEEDEAVMLLRATRSCPTLKRLDLFCIEEELSLSMAQIVKELTLTSVRILGGGTDQSSVNASSLVQETLVKAIEENHHIEHAYFDVDLPIEKFLERNKIRNAAEAVRDGKVPPALVPTMMNKIQQKCHYNSEKKNGKALSGTLLYSLLRSRPISQVMEAAKKHVVGATSDTSNPNQGARPKSVPRKRRRTK